MRKTQANGVSNVALRRDSLASIVILSIATCYGLQVAIAVKDKRW